MTAVRLGRRTVDMHRSDKALYPDDAITKGAFRRLVRKRDPREDWEHMRGDLSAEGLGRRLVDVRTT